MCRRMNQEQVRILEFNPKFRICYSFCSHNKHFLISLHPAIIFLDWPEHGVVKFENYQVNFSINITVLFSSILSCLQSSYFNGTEMASRKVCIG